MQRLTFVVATLLVCLCLSGATCNVHSMMDRVRTAHSTVREAGRVSDEVIHPLVTERDELCIERADAAGFPAGSGQEGMDYWRACMESYYTLVAAIDGVRIALEELEDIYDDIEAGVDRNASWARWTRSLVRHGRNIVHLCEVLGIDIPDSFTGSLDTICTLVHCEEGGES